MRRRTRIASRFSAWLCIVLFLLSCGLPAVSESDGDTFVEPRLSSDANPYDPEHPEILEENQLVAKSAILIEANSGEVVFEKNADQQMYPASTTKIMTAMLGLRIGKANGMLNEIVTLSDEAVNLGDEDATTIPLEAGEMIRFEDLLYATMVRSGNEGANAIAEFISGSVPAFVDLMNETAAYLGCASTHFTNPHGLHDDNHYTTARDLAIIAKAAMEDSTFRQIVASTSYALPASNLNGAKTVKLRDNPMMVQSEKNDYYYSYANGIKTGNTNQAGRCYVGSATKDGVTLISVVLYTSSNGRWTDTKKLMEYGFSQYISVTPVELYDMNPIVLETNGFSKDDPDMGRLPLYLVPMDSAATASFIATRAQVEAKARNLQQEVIIEYIRDFSAPITAGEQMGTLTYLPTDGSGSDPVEYALIASRSIRQRENAPKSIQTIMQETYEDPNPFPRFTVELLIMALLPFAGVYLILRISIKLIKRFTRKGSNLPKATTRRFR